MKEHCETCVFRRGDFCCRFPPSIIVDESSRYYPQKPFQPLLPGSRWCGEYKAKETRP